MDATKAKVGQKVQILGGTYGKSGMKGQITKLHPAFADVQVGTESYPKYYKNLKVLSVSKKKAVSKPKAKKVVAKK